jgi:DNA-binding response OmpR family regulator
MDEQGFPMNAVAPAKRILVVEDEWLIAEFYGDVLREEGFEVVGPAANVKAGRELIETHLLGAAILDVSLGKEKSYPLAKLLLERQIPFLFVSGYTDGHILPEYQHVPVIMKPVEGEQLPLALHSLLQSRDSDSELNPS